MWVLLLMNTNQLSLYVPLFSTQWCFQRTVDTRGLEMSVRQQHFVGHTDFPVDLGPLSCWAFCLEIKERCTFGSFMKFLTSPKCLQRFPVIKVLGRAFAWYLSAQERIFGDLGRSWRAAKLQLFGGSVCVQCFFFRVQTAFQTVFPTAAL